MALNRETGDEVWRAARPRLPSYGPPVVASFKGRQQIIVQGNRVAGYDPRSGRELWNCKAPAKATACTLCFDDQRVYSTGGYPERGLYSVNADGAGDVTGSNIRWRHERKSSTAYVPSPLLADGRLFVASDGGTATCFRADDGHVFWTARLGGGFSASPVLIGEYVIAPNEAGKTFVFKACDEYESIAENDMQEGIMASPVVSGGRLYLRTIRRQSITPSDLGCCLAAEHFGSSHYYGISTRRPDVTKVFHWLQLADTHIELDRAIARQDEVAVDVFINEFDVGNPDETDPSKRFRLYALLANEPKRLICQPDAAFTLSTRGHTKVFYLEIERGTNSPKQVAARKGPGYVELARRGLHRKHFPDATIDSFTVVTVATCPNHRDELRRAVKRVAGAELWKFVSATELSAEILDGPVFYGCEGDGLPLVRLR